MAADGAVLVLALEVVGAETLVVQAERRMEEAAFGMSGAMATMALVALRLGLICMDFRPQTAALRLTAAKAAWTRTVFSRGILSSPCPGARPLAAWTWCWKPVSRPGSVPRSPSRPRRFTPRVFIEMAAVCLAKQATPLLAAFLGEVGGIATRKARG